MRSKIRKKNYTGRCEKQSLEKFTTICKTYDPIQTAYANILVKNKDIAEVRCNVALYGDKCGEYMTDFVYKKADGDLMVRECIRESQKAASGCALRQKQPMSNGKSIQ